MVNLSLKPPRQPQLPRSETTRPRSRRPLTSGPILMTLPDDARGRIPLASGRNTPGQCDPSTSGVQCWPNHGGDHKVGQVIQAGRLPMDDHRGGPAPLCRPPGSPPGDGPRATTGRPGTGRRPRWLPPGPPHLGVIANLARRRRQDQRREGHTTPPIDSGRQASGRRPCCHKGSAVAYRFPNSAEQELVGWQRPRQARWFHLCVSGPSS